ncbi:MAG: T9SS type A sorting domain-containing protein [Crocinitomicaceae bacterium]|nr:T9SS type A sorting domain-containing protein [Crocinitomicaceae bacterium]
MKTFSTLLHVFVLTCCCCTSLAITYTTLADGAWSDELTVWSTDGSTACECTPGEVFDGDDIIINHAITMDYLLLLDGGTSFTLSASGELAGTFDLIVNTCMVNVYGNLSIAKFESNAESKITVNGAVLTTTNRVSINGILTIDNGELNISSGNFKVGTTGTVNLINGSVINVAAGNVWNYGEISICSDCCITSGGNWKNFSSGKVNGSGSATSELGNMSNTGIWDVNITWCSAGTDSGMPSTEDCATANINCGTIAFPLPLEIISYEANLIEENITMLTWETATEFSTDYFIIYKSNNGSNWEDIGRVKAAGVSSENLTYNFYDYEVTYGATYYKLIQLDTDGIESFSAVRSVYKSNSESIESLLFPNPSNTSTVTIVTHEKSSGSIEILNTSGRLVGSQKLDQNNTVHKVNLAGVSSGVYFVKVEQSGKRTTKKLILTLD